MSRPHGTFRAGLVRHPEPLSGISDAFRNSAQQMDASGIWGFGGSFYDQPSTACQYKTHMRCGTPDCDWGIPVLDLSQQEVSRCGRSFRKHCIERHGLHPKDAGRLCWFDLQVLRLTLLED